MTLIKGILIALTLLIVSCASMINLTPPDVSLMGIESIKGQGNGFSPRFKLRLLVTNPNNQDLEIEGVTFSLAIADKEILSGISNKTPTLVAYSETEIDVEAKISLFDLLRLLASLSQKSEGDINYLLETTIDPKGFMAITVDKKGMLTKDLLSGLKSAK